MGSACRQNLKANLQTLGGRGGTGKKQRVRLEENQESRNPSCSQWVGAVVSGAAEHVSERRPEDPWVQQPGGRYALVTTGAGAWLACAQDSLGESTDCFQSSATKKSKGEKKKEEVGANVGEKSEVKKSCLSQGEG